LFGTVLDNEYLLLILT